MSIPILATKLYLPSSPPNCIVRARLHDKLHMTLHRTLTLVSAPAGFGKTTLISSWVAQCSNPIAWLSIDERDNDLTRFLRYLIQALQTVMPEVGENAQALLQAPQPHATELILTHLLNDLMAAPQHLLLVLDDYHLIDTPSIDTALTFFLENLPVQIHLLIITREDPSLPLAKLRAKGRLLELRVADLRFTHTETQQFLQESMGVHLTTHDVTALERRTEGWIAGLQLAGISLQGQTEHSQFIDSFTGSHRFILDYLVEEVLKQQPEPILEFLLYTAILERMCGSLCEAILANTRTMSGQEMLRTLEQANLFVVPLDNERRWYRYHHLFGELLRQRLKQLPNSEQTVAILHERASLWYESQGLLLEAFHHAQQSGDMARTVRLLEGDGLPLHFRGAVNPVLHWLQSLPSATLDKYPPLWIMYASTLSMTGQMTEVEPKLQAAETALQTHAVDEKVTNNLRGHIAAIRALLALNQMQIEQSIAQSHKALALISADNVVIRTTTLWKLGLAHELQGNCKEAHQAYTETIAICQATGNHIIHLSAVLGLATVQMMQAQLMLATDSFYQVLQLTGQVPQRAICDAQLGLAQLYYEQNELEKAQTYTQKSLQIAIQIDNLDRVIEIEAFLAHLKFRHGELAEAEAILERIGQLADQHQFVFQIPQVAQEQIFILLARGDILTAVQLAQTHNLPLSQARAHLAEQNPTAVLTLLGPVSQQAKAKDWLYRYLQTLVLQALAYKQQKNLEKSSQIISEALTIAKPHQFVRLFIDEGEEMWQLLTAVQAQTTRHATYLTHLLTAFGKQKPIQQPLVDPLSDRELEILQLIAQGLSNRDISEKLFLALSTVKGHNRNIYDKLQVKRRTQAVTRARELGLL